MALHNISLIIGESKKIFSSESRSLVMIGDPYFALERIRNESMKEGSSSAKKALTE